MTVTLFTLPKRFSGIYETIQENALQSWAALQPKPEIILFGDEHGTRDAARRHGTHHKPDLATNSLGTPLVNHLFQTATKQTSTPWQGFVNADIILDPALPALLDRIIAWRPRALIVSRRWDLDVAQPIDTSVPNWFESLAHRARTEGTLYSHHGMDLFVFPTGLLDHMPPFSIGWPGAKYDNWMVYAARRLGIPVVDITDAITLIHQNHPSGPGTANPAKAQEHWINLDHLGGHGCCFDILDATHVVGSDGKIRRATRSRELLRRDVFRLAQRFRYRFRSKFLGFRYAQKSEPGH
ncbi:MAG: hypothetical protein QM760_18075 [Nibricoccus sp.]